MAKIPDDDDDGILMPILVSLLVVVGLVTAGLFGYIGYHAKMNQAAIIPSSSQEQPQTPAQSQQKAQVYMPNATENTSQEQKELSEDTPTVPEEQSNIVGEEKTPQKIDENVSTPTEKPQTSGGGNTNPSTAKPADSNTGTQQPAVNISPSSPSTTKPQTPSSGTQSGGSVLNSGSYADNFADGKVLVTTASDNNKDPVYHTTFCRSAQKIDSSDMRWIDSEQAAINEGRRLCGNCAKAK